ncbi:MAG: hypothetical protein PUF50_08530, partial [Erysipelotrichaceae bacterium]|nr:hypothetical protein [Erysipelotrichaceae bacterium]
MKDKITAEAIWKKRKACVEYNQSIDLYDTVKENENFYVGKQWEGVNAPDLDKPIFNFLKRVVSYFVSMICSDDITINIEPFKDDENGTKSLYCQFFKEEIYALFERQKIPSKLRQAVRDCAVDGDAAMYTYFEPGFETHQSIKGAVFVENTENTSILFGNHSSSDVSKQPYIIIEQRRYVDSLKEEAKELYKLTDEQIENIHSDNDYQENKEEKGTNQLCTVLFYFFKSKGSVHYVISTKHLILKEDTDLEIPDYPISYFSWDKIKNSYHGQAVLTGMIPNQIYVNKLFAMCMLYTQRMGFPWTVFDRTKIEQVTNKIGQAFGTNPDVANKLMDFYKAPDFSSQILNLIDIVINYTRDFMGANDASLGNVKPDNTSAIIAVQEASSIPLQMQKQAYNQFVEDTIRNMIDMMCATYGTREVRMPVHGQKGVYEYMTIDFSELKGINYSLSIDIGSSSPYDENSRMQTLGNLWDRKILDDAAVFVDSIPDKLLPNKDEIIKS